MKRQTVKSERVKGFRAQEVPLDSNHLVINLNSKTLHLAAVAVLSKGLNFAPMHTCLPVK